MRLSNRRFVAFYFDLATNGFAGDADALAFVTKAKPKLGGRRVNTPPVLFMTPEGRVVGEITNYASTEAMLATMRKVLSENPGYARPSPEEAAATTPLDRARNAFDLLDYDGVRAALAGEEGSAARYLLGRAARYEGKWEEMERHLALVTDEALASDVRMERAHALWQAKKFKELRDHLKDFPKASGRHTEARYYEGLAHFRLGEKEPAMAIWKSTITSCSEDPWIYRADWAYCNAGRKRGAVMMSSGGNKRTSLLNRIGYMGRRNPDLGGK